MMRIPMGLLQFILLLQLLSQPAYSAAPNPLVLGVFPNLPPRQIVEVYRPVADALEKQLKQRVVVYSAKDFKTFVSHTRQGEYDILLTAPHMAWLARQETGYRPLLKYTQPVHGLLVTQANGPFDSLQSLQGRIIATPDSIAIAVLAMQTLIAEQGMQPATDYRTLDAGTHLNAAMQVINGRAEGAILGKHAYMLMPANLRQQLQIVAETPPLSSLMFLTHPRVRDVQARSIRKGLLDFAAQPEGRDFIQRGGYGGLSDVSGNELQAFRPYALQMQKLLKNTR